MENNYLDRRVLEALDNLEAEFQAGHWEQMETLLNDPVNADLSEDTLDHSFRHQLTEVAPAFEDSHWDAFESQLDALETPEIEDVYLDGVTYELLNELQAPYNPAHWDIMQDRLEKEFSLRQKLIRYKVAELALFALAIFTLMPFLPLDKISAFRLPMAQKAQAEAKMIDKATSPTTATLPNKTLESQTQTPPPATPKAAQLAATNEASSNTIANLNTEQNESEPTPIMESTSSTNAPTAPIVESAKTPSNNLKPLALVEAIPATIIPANTAPRDLWEISDGKLSIPKRVDLASNPDQGIASIEKHLEIPVIEGKNLELLRTETPELKKPCLACKVWKGPSFLRVGMVGTGDLNYVMTPYDQEYLQAGYTRFEPGYGGGLTLGFKFGRWEIETGAMYASKYYNPDTINYLVNRSDLSSGVANLGYEGVGWEGTQLDILRIPVRTKYSFTHRGKWQVYAQGGLAMNMTMNRIHSKKIKRIAQRRPNGLRSPSSNSLSNVTDGVNENVGILNGGAVADNHYFSVDLGFGVERFLSTRFSVFAQPVFHYQLAEGNLGLNRERINNLSIEAGVRVSLKKNTPETH